MKSKGPMLPTPIPDFPWQHVAKDLFDCLGEKWLICIDYYSEYFELEMMKNGTHGDEIVTHSKKCFSTHRIPEEMTSGNEPPFNGYEFTESSQKYGFRHNTSSPQHAQANGLL